MNNNPDLSFWEQLFANFRERHYNPEPEHLYDFQFAIEVIRKRSGMTGEQIACRIGILPSALATHESRNGSSVNPELYNRLRLLALELDLPKAAKWFEAMGRRSTLKKWRKNEEIIGRPKEREYES